VLSAVSDTPYWVGVVLAGAGVATTLALGGMRAATYVQAFQFVLKLVLFIVPAVWLLVVVGPAIRHDAVHPVEFTHFRREAGVTFRVGVGRGVAEPTTVRVGDEPRLLEPGTWEVPPQTTAVFPAGARVPVVRGEPLPGGSGWQRPLLDLQNA